MTEQEFWTHVQKTTCWVSSGHLKRSVAEDFLKMKDTTTMSEIADGKSVAESVEGTCGRLEAEPSAQSF
jgi:hypothetical protein